MCYAGFIFIAIPEKPSVENQGFELGKYKNGSIVSRAYMPHHYLRHPHL